MAGDVQPIKFAYSGRGTTAKFASITFPGHNQPAAVGSAVGIGVPESRRTSRQQCGFFHVRRHGTSYGRAVRGHLRMRRFLDPVRQPRTVPPTLIGVGEAENTNRYRGVMP